MNRLQVTLPVAPAGSRRGAGRQRNEPPPMVYLGQLTPLRVGEMVLDVADVERLHVMHGVQHGQAMSIRMI